MVRVVAFGLAHPVVGDLVPPAGLDVAVDAVDRGVQPAPDEPLGEGQVPLEHRVPVAVPGQPARPALPTRPRGSAAASS